MLKELTGIDPPPSPIDRETYEQFGFPWYQQYDVGPENASVSEELFTVKSLGERAADAGMETDKGHAVSPDFIIRLPSPGTDSKPGDLPTL